MNAQNSFNVLFGLDDNIATQFEVDGLQAQDIALSSDLQNAITGYQTADLVLQQQISNLPGTNIIQKSTPLNKIQDQGPYVLVDTDSLGQVQTSKLTNDYILDDTINSNKLQQGTLRPQKLLTENIASNGFTLAYNAATQQFYWKDDSDVFDLPSQPDQVLRTNTLNDQKVFSKIDNLLIDDNTITSLKLSDGTLDYQKLVQDINVDSKLLQGSISFNKLQNDLTLSKFSLVPALQDLVVQYDTTTGVVSAQKIQNRHIVDNTITAQKIQDGTLNLIKFLAEPVNQDLVIQYNSTTGIVAASKVQQRHFDLNTINASVLVDASITSAKIGNNQVQTANLANSAIIGQKIQNDTIDGGTKIIDNTIDPIKIRLPQGGNPTNRLGYIIGNNSNISVDWVYINQNHIDFMTGKIKAANLDTSNAATLNYNLSYNGTQLYWKPDAVNEVSTADTVYNANSSNLKQFSKMRTALFDVNTINGNIISDNSIDGSKIITGSLNGELKIQANSITSTRIQQRSIVNESLGGLPEINTGKLLSYQNVYSPGQVGIIASYLQQNNFQTNTLNSDMFLDRIFNARKLKTPQTLSATEQGYVYTYDNASDGFILVNPTTFTSIPDNSITENKLQIFNNPTNGYFLKYDINGLEWAVVNSITTPSTIQSINSGLLNRVLAYSDANNFQWAQASQLIGLNEISYNKLDYSGSPLDGQVLIYDNGINKFSWRFVNQLLQTNSIPESLLAINNSPLNNQVLGYFNDGLGTEYMQWVDPNATSGVPDGYFVDNNFVNLKFAPNVIEPSRTRFLGSDTSSAQQVVCSNTSGFYQRQIFAQLPDNSTFNCKLPFLQDGNETSIGYSNQARLKLSTATTITHSNQTYAPSQFNTGNNLTIYEGSAEEAIILMNGTIDRIASITAADTGSFAQGAIHLFYDQDNLQGYGSSPSYYYVNNTGAGASSSQTKKTSIRDKEITGYFDQLMSLKPVTYKLKSYEQTMQSPEYQNFDQKKKDRIAKKAKRTYSGFIVEQLAKDKIWMGCHMEKFDCPEYEDMKQKHSEQTHPDTGLNHYEMIWHTIVSIQDLYRTIIQPQQQDIDALKISYQKPEERKELVQKMISISQTECLDIINSQQIIPMSSIRPCLSPGILYQNNDGIIGTLSSVDVFQLDSCVSLIQDLQNENQQQQQQINLLLSNINNLTNVIGTLKTQIQTLASTQQSIQMRLSSNGM